ncbi:hypothetical protein ZYGR_0AI03830 [Zygosaccharomyces rouxii]|uniref:NADP-dependent oxidoreductase domain-containing protein n=1 Tax=Zygosaccharomyces rouxii TaxID=4956 RepID=A0A1Q3ABT7_ZYGRO|nr:hypothetical protein ZYGR_0AI03830 [Zygosaccharomyces rouxii]
MSFHQEFFTLNNGNKIPAVAVIGTGTRWYKKEETEANFSHALVKQIEYALTLPGLVHVDHAEVYRTYPELSEALKNTKRPRSEFFITDKYSIQEKITNDPKEGLYTGLKRTGLEYVDLYLLHSPFASKEKNGFAIEEAWAQLEELYHEGKAKNIGVSNFRVEDLEKILKVAKVKPQVNQIEFSAFLQNQTPGVVKFSQDHDIQLEAYAPLGPLSKRDEGEQAKPFYDYLKKLTEKYNKTEAQVLLRWVARRGILPVTTSGQPKRIEDAQNLFSFDLAQDEVDEITKLGLTHPALRLYWNAVYDQYNAESQKP